MYNPVRGGNRGGRDQFTWDEIRLMPFKERECYLGSTVKIGYLDKGGRWRMRDWWTKGDNGPTDKDAMAEELRRVKEEDDRRMREALGLETKQVDKGPHLSEYELHELTKKNRDDAPEVEEAERMPGLGFNPGNAKFRQVDMNAVYDQTDYNKLAGEGVRADDVKKSEKKARREEVAKVLNNDLPVVGSVLDESKKIKKEKKKKDKKDKKEKKDKKHKKEKKHKKKERRDRDDSEDEKDRKKHKRERSRHDDSD